MVIIIIICFLVSFFNISPFTSYRITGKPLSVDMGESVFLIIQKGLEWETYAIWNLMTGVFHCTRCALSNIISFLSCFVCFCWFIIPFLLQDKHKCDSLLSGQDCVYHAYCLLDHSWGQYACIKHIVEKKTWVRNNFSFIHSCRSPALLKLLFTCSLSVSVSFTCSQL